MAKIREEQAADVDAIRELNQAAFATGLEARLVDRLRADGSIVASLVALDDDRVVGHIAFSPLQIHVDAAGAARTIAALALAPMAVRPAFQRQGIGTRLVRAGVELCAARGHRIVLVVGDPAYYSRFGFSTALALPLRSPYSGPASMALELEAGALASVAGSVEYAEAFSDLG